MRTQATTPIDYRLFTFFGLIVLIGLVMLVSASMVVGHERFGDSYFFIKRQLLLGIVPGILAFFFFLHVDYRFLKKYYILIFAATVLLLIAPFIPGVGSTLGTAAKSWLVIGNFSFQPSEVAKLGLIIFLAGYLAEKGSHLHDLKKGFLPTLFLACVPTALIVVQPDIGTSFIFFAIIFGLLLVAEARWSHLGLLAAAGIAGFFAMIVVAPYRAARLSIFLHPELDPQGVGYHVNQAVLAVGSGGIFGLGLGQSRQKFAYLPEVHADSIFAVMAEELGFVLITVFLLLLLAFWIRGLKFAKAAPDPFGTLLAAGIIVWFVTQSIMNIGAMVGLLPLTGVPLPFVSHGGTALMVAMAATGVLLNISRHSQLPSPHHT